VSMKTSVNYRYGRILFKTSRMFWVAVVVISFIGCAESENNTPPLLQSDLTSGSTTDELTNPASVAKAASTPEPTSDPSPEAKPEPSIDNSEPPTDGLGVEPPTDDPSAEPLSGIDNNLLLSLYPDRETMFGEDIEKIPNPSFYLDEIMASWNYEIANDQLVSDLFEAPLSHRLVWQRYVELTLPEHRGNLNAVKFIVNDNSSHYASVSISNLTKVPGEGQVELHLSEQFVRELYNASQGGGGIQYNLTSTLLHEHAHVLEAAQLVSIRGEYEIPTYTLGENYLRVMWDSPLRSYYRGFWEGEIYDNWLSLQSNSSNAMTVTLETFPNAFVTLYAATSPHEDFAESFLQFIELDSMPVPDETAATRKILWFWNQPEYVDIRNYARAAF